MWLLPAFLLRHIWLCPLEKQLYTVAAWSFTFHTLWFVVCYRVAHVLEPKDLQLRGWMMLMTQGMMNSFLYPLLLSHETFGEKSLACAVLWDLGGNMWICQFALFAIAAHFAPRVDFDQAFGGVDDRGDHDSWECERLMSGDDDGEEMAEWGPAAVLRLSAGAQKKSAASAASSALSMGKAAISGLFGVAPGYACMPRSVLVDALRQPVLICCVVGFLLNCCSVPLLSAGDMVLWAVGEPYKMVLYFLVGFYGDHQIDERGRNLVGRALGTRCVISLVFVVLASIALPLEDTYRRTVTLALFSPTSSYLIHLVAEHGYGESLLQLTVCGGLASTIVSTLTQHMLIEYFEAG